MAKYVGKRVVPKHCGAWSKNKEYEMLSIVLDEASGESYISRRVVPTGTLLTDEYYWSICSLFSQQIADMGEEFEERQQAITQNNAETLRQIRADNDATEQAIRQDNTETKQYVDTSLQETSADLTNRINQASANLNQASEQFASTGSALTARLDSIVGGATEDSEILDARVDAEGITHENLGSATRSILPRIKTLLLKKSEINLVPGDEYWEIGNIDPETGDDCNGNSNCRTTIYTPIPEGIRTGTAYYGGEERPSLVFVLFYSNEAYISRSTVFQDPVKGSKKVFSIPAGTTRLRFAGYRPSHFNLKEIIPENLFVGLGDNFQSFPDREVVDVERLIDSGAITLDKLDAGVTEFVDQQIAGQITEVREDLEKNGADSILITSSTNLAPLEEDWEVGNISPTTGEDITGNSNARCKMMIPVNGEKQITVALENETDFTTLFVLYYSEEGFIDRGSPLSGNYERRSAVVTLPDGTAYIRLCIYRSGVTGLNNLIPRHLFVGLGSGYQSFPNKKVLDADHVLDYKSISLDKLGDDVQEYVQERVAKSEERLVLTPSVSNLFPLEGWELGGINVEDGEENTNAGTIRATVRVPLEGGAKYTVKDFSDEIKYSYMFLYLYSADDTYLDRFGYFPDRQPVATYTMPENVGYVRFTIYGQTRPQMDMFPKKMVFLKGNTMPGYIAPNVIDMSMIDEESIPEGKILYDKKYLVPDYYKTHIAEKALRVKELANGCAAYGDVFIFITDQHWTINQKSSLSLIKYLEENVNIPRLFSGGDEANAANGDFCRQIREVFHGKIYHAVGNHEYFSHTTGSQLYYDFDSFNDDQIGNLDRHYYYVDNPQQQIRYIILNSFCEMDDTSVGATPGYEQEQLDWLRNVALNVPAGWTMLIFTHMFYNVTMVENKLSMTAYAQACMAVLDAYDGEGTIAAVIQGHTHRDRIASTHSGIPVIITTCDKNGQWVSSTGALDLLVDRSEGTIREQAFDVMVLNKKERTITAVRIGCPAEGGTGDDPGEEVGERVVHY